MVPGERKADDADVIFGDVAVVRRRTAIDRSGRGVRRAPRRRVRSPDDAHLLGRDPRHADDGNGNDPDRQISEFLAVRAEPVEHCGGTR